MSLKVALLGNMNNNQFALARYLRDAGVDADLLLFDNEVGHFGPAADTFDLGYQRYCRTLEWGTPMGVVTTPKRTIAADLGPYDVIIGCGPAPAYCERIGRTLDVFVPYGGDLLELTQYALGRPEALHRRWHAVHLQRLGIRRSAIVHMAPCPMFEGRYAQLQPRSERWALGLPMIHLPTYDRSSIERHAAKTHWWSEFQRVREQHDVLLFAHARHVWRWGPTPRRGGRPPTPGTSGAARRPTPTTRAPTRCWRASPTSSRGTQTSGSPWSRSSPVPTSTRRSAASLNSGSAGTSSGFP
jgi:hypothetical protein